MLLRSFRAQGFKNFRQPVVLDELGPINVIHGPNNVGKSNVLQAMELFFWLLGVQGTVGVPLKGAFLVSEMELAARGFLRGDIFNLEAPAPIRLEAEIELTPDDVFKAEAMWSALALSSLRVALVLQWSVDRVTYKIEQFEVADGRDFTLVDLDNELNQSIATVARILSKSHSLKAEPRPRFKRIDIDRRNSSTNLALELYDAKEAADFKEAQRWERFVDAMGDFEEILGEGRFVAAYNRQSNQASLFYQTQTARIPLSLLGSGVQQLAAVLGTVLVEGATIVGLEEPELNLRYTLQQRLREVLQKKIVGVPGGLDQLFITSHSDAFEAGAHFYLMEPTPDGPTVTKRPLDQARTAIGMLPDGRQPPPNAPLCYISTEGVVRVPERIRNVIGLPKGGGIVFLEHRDGHVEVMSDETFAKRYEPSRDENGNDA
jgi:hypothetical protein